MSTVENKLESPDSPSSFAGSDEHVVSVHTHDEEDDVNAAGDDEEESPKTFPYRMVGVVFLLVAIVTAIVLAAVPASLNSAHSISNDGVNYVFKALIGAFLFFLFSCLFFTYYLGSSRDTWDNPLFTPIRLNFSNITALIGLLLEFLQVVSFSLNYKAVFTGSENLRNLQYLALPYGKGESFVVMYWIMFVVAFSPYIFVVSVRMVIYSVTRRQGEEVAAGFVQEYQQKIYSILWILVNTIYIPVISTMMSGVDCTFRDVHNGSQSTDNTMDSLPSMVCLTRPHIKYIVCTLLALVIYYPAASFAQSQTQNISDIKFKPKIVFVFVQGKVLLVAADVFITDFTKLYLSIVLCIDVVFLAVNIWRAPCLVHWINQLRTIFFVISVVTAVASLIATNPTVSPHAPLAVLVIGWVGAGIGLPILFFAWHKLRVVTK